MRNEISTGSKTTDELPAYLRSYAADVDRWHLAAVEARSAR